MFIYLFICAKLIKEKPWFFTVSCGGWEYCLMRMPMMTNSFERQLADERVKKPSLEFDEWGCAIVVSTILIRHYFPCPEQSDVVVQKLVDVLYTDVICALCGLVTCLLSHLTRVSRSLSTLLQLIASSFQLYLL